MKRTLLGIFIAVCSALQLNAADVAASSLAVQTLFPRGPSHTITYMGDSYTLADSLGIQADEYHPEVCASILRGQLASVKARNFGHSGDTTSQMLARCWVLNWFETPDIIVLYGGPNDSGATNLTRTNLTALILAGEFNALSYVPTENTLQTGYNPGDRMIVVTDAGSNGGAAAYNGLTTTITGAGSGTTVWECRNKGGGTNGWGRIATTATTATHCTKFVVVGQHYLNYSSGGDTGATSTSNASLIAIQTSIPATITASGTTVIFVDSYASFRAFITSGQETQGSFSWHVADSNAHLNARGENYLGQFVAAAISAQSGWLTALK